MGSGYGERGNELWKVIFVTYVKDGNGTKEEWDLHDLSGAVVPSGSFVVRFRAAV